MKKADSFSKPEIILASSSPRRREFLDRLGLPCRVLHPNVDERGRGAKSPAEYALRNAVDKARQIAAGLAVRDKRHGSRRVVVAADTIVVLDNRILEKPSDRPHARAMLRALSGRRHQVITGLCILGVGYPEGQREKSLTVSTDVEFKKLTDAEIDAYVATGEPMDKAGAYAVQGIGSFMVRSVHGSYTNVVGLPLCEMMDILEKDFEYPVFS